MNNKGKAIAVAILLFSLLAFLITFEESAEFKGFPVPKMAKLTQQQHNLESYDWGSASEENGLPLRYQAIIRIWGWKKIEQEGALTVYEKDGRQVEVVSLTDYLSLSSSDSLSQ
jgi:hypothetical protein